MEAIRDWMSLAKPAVVGSAMGDDMEAAEDVGEAGVEGVVAAGFGGGAEVEEECLEADTRLSRVSVLKVAGPRLRSS
jgi:L-asparaginase/Glu-tRNA(Gln) amidotransferase subunit D